MGQVLYVKRKSKTHSALRFLFSSLSLVVLAGIHVFGGNGTVVRSLIGIVRQDVSIRLGKTMSTACRAARDNALTLKKALLRLDELCERSNDEN